MGSITVVSLAAAQTGFAIFLKGEFAPYDSFSFLNCKGVIPTCFLKSRIK